MTFHKIKAVLFDIGGVVVGSPIVGIQSFEKEHGLPPHYLNALITSYGERGAFQRLECGELVVGEEFWDKFGREMSDRSRGVEAYEVYCKKMKINERARIPDEINIDGKELWLTMMQPALEPDPNIVAAINNLIKSGHFLLGALTNNALLPSSDAPAPKTLSAPSATEVPDLAPALRPGRRGPTPVSYDKLKASLEEQARDGRRAGGSSELLRGLFDVFVESAVEGLRKPDEKFYRIALERLGVQPEEVVFLDDIGRNLVPARKMGMHTIRKSLIQASGGFKGSKEDWSQAGLTPTSLRAGVHPGRSAEAVAELEKLVGFNLKRTGSSAKL